MDTDVERAILVHLDNDHVLKFLECHDGLYYYDMTRPLEHTGANDSNATFYDYSFLQTVEGNKANYSRREIVGADKARRVQELIGWPGNDFYNEIVENNWAHNTTITKDDIHRADNIHGDATPLLQGKMKRTTPITDKNKKTLANTTTHCQGISRRATSCRFLLRE